MFFTSSGKNWDLTAALSDFEQLRQVHAGSLSYSFPEEREQALTEHKDMTRVGRPLLHRQDDVVQGEVSLHSDSPHSAHSTLQHHPKPKIYLLTLTYVHNYTCACEWEEPEAHSDDITLH